MRAALPLLRERDVRLLFGAQALSLLGSGMVSVALSFAVLDASGSVADLGLVLASRNGALAVMLLPAGVVADRLSRRSVMACSDVVSCLAQGVLALLVLTGTPSLWQFCALQAVSGAALAFVLSAVSGLTPEVVAPERLQQANALRSFTGAAGNLAGPPIAGLIVAGAGSGYALAVDAATFAGSAVLLAALRVHPRPPTKASPFARDLADGWRAFRSRRWILLANAHAAVMNVFVLAPFYVLGPAVAKRSLGGAGAWALILTAFGIGLVCGSLTAASVRVRRRMLVGVVLGAVFAPPLALLAIRAPALAVAPFALLAGAQLTLLNTFWETTIQEQFPPALISRVTSIDWLSSIATAPLGFALAGVAGDSALGLGNTLGVAAAIALVASVLIAAFPSIRALRASEP